MRLLRSRKTDVSFSQSLSLSLSQSLSLSVEGASFKSSDMRTYSGVTAEIRKIKWYYYEGAIIERNGRLYII